MVQLTSFFKGIVVYNLKILVDLLYMVFVKNELVKLTFMDYQNTQQRSPHFWFFNIFSLDLQGQKLSQRLDNKTPSEKFANHFFVLGVNILFGLRKKKSSVYTLVTNLRTSRKQMFRTSGNVQQHVTIWSHFIDILACWPFPLSTLHLQLPWSFSWLNDLSPTCKNAVRHSILVGS